MKTKTKSWKQIEKKLFTREEIAAAERFAESEILDHAIDHGERGRTTRGGGSDRGRETTDPRRTR